MLKCCRDNISLKRAISNSLPLSMFVCLSVSPFIWPCFDKKVLAEGLKNGSRKGNCKIERKRTRIWHVVCTLLLIKADSVRAQTPASNAKRMADSSGFAFKWLQSEQQPVLRSTLRYASHLFLRIAGSLRDLRSSELRRRVQSSLTRNPMQETLETSAFARIRVRVIVRSMVRC